MLHFDIVGPTDAMHTAFLCHGILGAGRNWRGFARQLVQRLPNWRFVLVDLRSHGNSGRQSGANTLDGCAQDLQALADQLGPVEVAIGHSFGGKVVLAWSQQNPTLSQVWVLDSPPGRHEGERSEVDALGVIDAVGQVPQPCASREEARAQLTAHGFSAPLVSWLLTSLKRQEDGWRWAWHLPDVESMIDDYLQRDFGPYLRHATTEIHLVRAQNSDRWTTDAGNALAGEHVNFHVLPNAGHWLHVDNPTGLQDMLVTHWQAHPC